VVAFDAEIRIFTTGHTGVHREMPLGNRIAELAGAGLAELNRG